MIKSCFVLILGCLFFYRCINDCTAKDFGSESSDSLRIGLKHFIAPAILIGYGLVGLDNDKVLFINNDLKLEVNEHIDDISTIDNYIQYAPAVFIYGCHLAGWKGVHNTGDVLALNFLSLGIMAAIVNPLKEYTHVLRPDGSTYYSFPSGHTATAFANAELLWREYSGKSKLIGYAGYGLATCTGIYRIRNNRHWLSDVVAGAGVGILSTKLAYILYPHIKRFFFTKNDVVLLPYINRDNNGLLFSMRF